VTLYYTYTPTGNYEIRNFASVTGNEFDPTPGDDTTIKRFRCTSCTLPVELTWFGGNRNEEGQADLAWRTASEKNNSHFIVERSIDAVTFERVGTVAGNGTTSEIKHYAFTDVNAPASVVYYRLTQVDFDGATSVSKVVRLQALNAAAPKLAAVVYPNPANATATLAVTNAPDGTAVRILDTRGRLMMSRTLSAGASTSSLELTNLEAGLYIVQLTSQGEAVTLRLTVQR
jgi:hypothetical protein